MIVRDMATVLSRRSGLQHEAWKDHIHQAGGGWPTNHPIYPLVEPKMARLLVRLKKYLAFILFPILELLHHVAVVKE
jgi:hypothetical protein